MQFAAGMAFLVVAGLASFVIVLAALGLDGRPSGGDVTESADAPSLSLPYLPPFSLPFSLPFAPPSDPAAPDTLGWRTWLWNIRDKELYSPMMHTVWNGSELRCGDWTESEVVRGVAGIHAHLVPKDWGQQRTPDNWGVAVLAIHPERGLYPAISIDGIVERFDRYVLGTEGWRAEWVTIRKLAAPTTEIGLALEQAFPDVEIVYV